MALGTQQLRKSAMRKVRNSELETQNSTLRNSEVQRYWARILIESVRFPPFGFDTVEISFNMNDDISCLQKDLLCPDSDRERSVSPLRVRYNGDELKCQSKHVVFAKRGFVPAF